MKYNTTNNGGWIFATPNESSNYSIRCSENGFVFDIADTLKEAYEIIAASEAEDVREDLYSDNFYEIYDNNLDEIIV